MGIDSMRATARRCALALVAASLCLCMLPVFTPIAHAELGDTDEKNLVDPTQRADNSFIRETSIGSLVEQGSFFDGREVQVAGEVIGDCIAATDLGYSWITLTVTDAEDKTSISVLLPDEQTAQIDHYGRYGVTGTILQVSGIFHQACNDHDGLPDIHASSSSVMARGEVHRDAFVVSDFVPGIVTVLAGGALIAAFYYARERTR